MSDCLICEQIAAVGTLPGGALVDAELVVAYHLPRRAARRSRRDRGLPPPAAPRHRRLTLISPP